MPWFLRTSADSISDEDPPRSGSRLARGLSFFFTGMVIQVSQRTGTRLPTRAEQRKIRKELALQALPDPVPGAEPLAEPEEKPWLERFPTEREQRDLAERLISALDTALKDQLANLELKRKSRKLPLESLTGAAEAAKEVVSAYFAEWTTQAAISERRARVRRDFVFTSRGDQPTIIDMTDGDMRTKVGFPPAPAGVIEYLMGFGEPKKIADAAGLKIRNGTPAETKFYNEKIVKALLGTLKQHLELYDRYGFTLTDPKTARIFIVPHVVGWHLAQTEEASNEVWQEKWSVFERLVHEFIHVLEHPLVPGATNQSAVVREGICEYLTAEVIRNLGNTAKHDTDLKPLSKKITGNDRAPSRQHLIDYKYTKDYQGFVDRVVVVRDIVGDNGIRAAFFQGHFEFIGLDRFGDWLPGADESTDQMKHASTRGEMLPLHFTGRSIAWLAAATGKDESDVARRNPGLDKVWAKAPGALSKQIFVPGYRTHLVAVDDEGASETWDQIAAQHGLSPDLLRKINNFGLDAPTPATEAILVPVT